MTFNKRLFGGAINTHILNKGNVKTIYADNSYLDVDIVERLDKDTVFNLYNELGKTFPKYLGNDTFLYLSGDIINSRQLNRAKIKHIAMVLNDIHSKKVNKINTPTINSRLKLYEKVLKSYGVYTDTFKNTIEYLKKNQPKFKPVFIHGDFKLNNIKFEKDKVSGVFDLEFAKHSSHCEDIAWLFSDLWGDNNQWIGEFLKHYKGKVKKSELEYWLVFAKLRFACIAIQQHARGMHIKDVELYVTGWRLAEIEKDLSVFNNLLKNKNNLNIIRFSLFTFLKLALRDLILSLVGKKSLSNTVKYICKGFGIYLKL
ncbi:MAG: phosphotransferase [Alphaproteobacteria bacterium]